MSIKKSNEYSHTGDGESSQKVKAKPSKQRCLRNDSKCRISIDGVGALPPGKTVPIPAKVLDRILADEKGLKKINVSVV